MVFVSLLAQGQAVVSVVEFMLSNDIFIFFKVSPLGRTSYEIKPNILFKIYMRVL